MAVLLSKVFAGPAAALLAAIFWGIVAKVVVIPGKIFRGCGLYPVGPVGPVLGFCWG